jgi:hypothetical protein
MKFNAAEIELLVIVPAGPRTHAFAWPSRFVCSLLAHPLYIEIVPG